MGAALGRGKGRRRRRGRPRKGGLRSFKSLRPSHPGMGICWHGCLIEISAAGRASRRSFGKSLTIGKYSVHSHQRRACTQRYSTATTVYPAAKRSRPDVCSGRYHGVLLCRVRFQCSNAKRSYSPGLQRGARLQLQSGHCIGVGGGRSPHPRDTFTGGSFFASAASGWARRWGAEIRAAAAGAPT